MGHTTTWLEASFEKEMRQFAALLMRQFLMMSFPQRVFAGGRKPFPRRRKLRTHSSLRLKTQR